MDKETEEVYNTLMHRWKKAYSDEKMVEKLRKDGKSERDIRQTLLLKVTEDYVKEEHKKDSERLGVVYTPIEVVDFINNSVQEVLKEEFGVSISDENVTIMDPFTGTGIFLTRLIQSGLIEAKDLERKYNNELFANEIMPLPFHIASAMISEAYREEMGNEELEPFPGIQLKDTFADYKKPVKKLRIKKRKIK